MTKFTYPIQDAQGLHMRPAGQLAREAAACGCNVTIEKTGSSAVDAKSVFSIMRLGVRSGEKVTVCCTGADEEAATAKLEDFFRSTL